MPDVSQVRFASAVNYNAATELSPGAGAGLEPDYLRRYAQALENGGFDLALLGYSSDSPDPFTVAGALSQLTSTIRPTLAVRPNTVHPTWAARALASLDQLSGGRITLHVISGGSDADQAREGDVLDKASRYARTDEWLEILQRSWASDGPIDFDGDHYTIRDFRASVKPVDGRIPISFAGSSAEAYDIGARRADIYALWAEPVEQTRQQVETVRRLAAAAGRAEAPEIWLSLRPIIAPTEELAWEKAYRVLGALEQQRPRLVGGRDAAAASVQGPSVQNAGSQRLLEAAARGERFDRALWTPLVTASGASGASVAVVGTPDTVVQQILDFVDVGVSIFAMRGYDNLNDVIDYGRHLIPAVHAELASRGSSQVRAS